jgi:hypothetical protein
MHLRTKILSGILVSTLVFTSLAEAAGKGPKPKLSAPTNVTCSVVAGIVQVSWDVVPDANAYQVEHVGILSDGTVVSESDFVLLPPVSIEVDDFATLTVHVRALQAPKHEGGPLQGSGPKGTWSEACIVDLVTL